MSPRSSEEFEKIRKKRQESILNVALRLFADGGFRATSMSKIAQNAGIAKGLIYNYFESKQELLEKVIQKGFENSLPEIDENSLKTQDPRTIFINTIQKMGESIKKHPHFWQLYARFFMRAYENQSLSKIMSQYSKQYYEYLGNLLSALQIPDVETETYKLAGTLDGILLHYLAIEDYPLEKVGQSIIDEYLDKSKLES